MQILSQLENSLHIQGLKQKEQQKQINYLLVTISNINLKYHYLSHSYIPEINLFTKVRLEMLAQVYVFLDLKSLMEIRLVNKICYYQISQIASILLVQLELKIMKNKEIQKEIELECKNYYSDKILIDLSELQNIPEAEFYDIRLLKLRRPPDLIVKILYFICVLLDPTFNSEDDPWFAAVSFTRQTEEKFYKINPVDISEKQLSQLKEIYELIPEDIQRQCNGAMNIYKYIKLLVDLRREQYYISSHKLLKVKANLEKMTNDISILNKIKTNRLG